MNPDIRSLEPQRLWNKFANLNAVPRPSKKEERVIRFMVNFGKSLGLETFTDTIGNVIIRKPASPGMENRKMMTLQSHLDMVHQKNADTKFDFDTQGIAMYIDGDWVKAKGTTLGADNGLGVATIMALLEGTEIAHPPLEALFTIDEETGMTGALGLEPNVLQGTILLNLDTEEDDELDIGCAGGIDVTAEGTYESDLPLRDHVTYEITVKGLSGGHSGIEIHKGLGNANTIMNGLLFAESGPSGMRIIQIEGGGLRNAIPRESKALVAVPKDEARDFEARMHRSAETIVTTHKKLDPEMNIGTMLVTASGPPMKQEAQAALLEALKTAHNGVYAMSAEIPDLVETSNNIARVTVRDGRIQISCLTRSSLETGKMELAGNLRETFEKAGYQVTFSGDYPGWKPNPKSPILKVLEETYTERFGERPKVVACHAGLECGILGRHYPEMDMISFGPTILGAHSPDERVQISSVQKFWGFLLDVLKKTPKLH